MKLSFLAALLFITVVGLSACVSQSNLVPSTAESYNAPGNIEIFKETDAD